MEHKNDDFSLDENWLDELLGIEKPKEKPASEEILSDSWATGQIPSTEDGATAPKERPKKRSGKDTKKKKKKKDSPLWGIPHILVTVVWLAIIVVVGVSLGRTLWVCCADLMAFGKPDKAITITITDKEVSEAPNGMKAVDIDGIAQKLADAGLIEHPDLFVLFATLTGKDQDISVGTFTLNSYYDYNAMINGMAHNAPAREIVTVLVPEGYNCAQTFALLEEKGVCTAKELEEYAANGELNDYWFLDGVKRGSKYCLEGYLFPDTYDFYTNDDPRRVLEKFLNDFNYRFSDLMKEDFVEMQARYGKMLASHGYSKDYIAENPLTMHQLVTLASIVERESSSGAESFDIASVFYNRLTNAKEYPFLDSDATVHYAIGDYFGKIKTLTSEHLATNSPYNTRGVQKGLPAGPICNPGIYSLYAVLDPNDTGYYYFLLNPKTGVHVFARTYAEHQKNVKDLGYK